MQKSFSIIQLQAISTNGFILRACPGVKPFSLANNINDCKLKADAALKDLQSKLDLINERRTDENKAECDADALTLFNTPLEIEIPEIKAESFKDLDISGEREVAQQDSSVKKFSYAEAYFGLFGLVIL